MGKNSKKISANDSVFVRIKDSRLVSFLILNLVKKETIWYHT